ncbi:MAG: cob(I)yrinic acid a,c-diamide adenosyltransferase [Synergistaceae bacterium]|nr:cob(I)yrinic acid a,c-diamide adenosyltransferase [Synergistaceae bacterium]
MAEFNIITKGGDKGTTSLANGERIAKDDARVELYGTLDECQAALGLARSLCGDEKTAEDIYFLEDYLFGAMAYFAKCDYDEPDPAIMENMAARITEALPGSGMSFVRPGDNRCGAALHLARTVARRAERVATRLFREGGVNEKSYKFLNRLSDVIYLLSLKVDADSKK